MVAEPHSSVGVVQEVNNGIAKHGGRLQLGQLDPEGVERWVTTKKAQVLKQASNAYHMYPRDVQVLFIAQ